MHKLHHFEDELESVVKQAGAQAGGLSSAGGPVDLATFTKDLNHNLNISDRQATAQNISNPFGIFETGKPFEECNNHLDNQNMIKIFHAYGSQDELNVDINTKLQQVQKDKHASHLRLKDSKSHVEEIEKMLHLLEEVQVTKRSEDIRLQKTKEEALMLNRKMKSQDTFLKECHWPCSSQWQHSSTMEKASDQRRLLNLPAERDFKHESEVKHQLPKHPIHQECAEVHKDESVENLIDSIVQEMAVLSNKLGSSTESSVCLMAKLDLLKKLTELKKARSCQENGSMASVNDARHKDIRTSYNPHQENDQLNHLMEEILEKEQLTTTVEKQGLQLHTLTEEHKKLQLLYSCKIKESEGVVLQLQSHLKHVETELDQVKCLLRTLKEKDDHVTCRMQKELNAKRRQCDYQQNKIRHLQKIKDKLSQEMREKKHQFQELDVIQMEKTQLAKELEAEKSRKTLLREQITELEGVIHKMSGSVAGCQEFIQLQEQEYYRLKLKHMFDLKQLRPSSDFGSQHKVKTKTQRPHTAHADRSVCGKRPDPDGGQSTAFTYDKMEVKGGNQERRKHSQSKSHLKTNKQQRILVCGEPVTSTPATTSPQLLGRRSPVHTLLTSKPNLSLL